MQGTANGICGVQSSVGAGFFPPHYTVFIHRMREVGGFKRSIQGSSNKGPFNRITTTTYPALWPTHSCTMGTGSLSQV